MIPILFEHADFLVCVKPVGMDAENALPQALSVQTHARIYPVHRLDLNVGGVMVYAKTPESARRLSALVQSGDMQKEYIAMCHGVPEPSGDMYDLLFKDTRKNKVFVVKRMRQGVREARLHYETLSVLDSNTSLVRIRLYTGRSHQIRVQFASRGFPLLGDHKYGARDSLHEPRLFSCALRFPWKGVQMAFTAWPDWAEGEGISLE